MKNFGIKLFCVLTLIISFASNVYAKDYSDLKKDHWAYKNIQVLSERNIVVGYPNGKFNPDAPVTRAEFATMVIKTLNQQKADIKETIMFKDLDISFWGWDNIQRAVTFDLIKGYDDGNFKPDGTVTRAEAITVAVNALTTENISEAKAKKVLSGAFVDYNSIPTWFFITAGKAEILGLVVKLPGQETTLYPDKPATRAELSVLMCNMLELARLNPNKKLADAMKPQIAQGKVLKNVEVNNYIATIPQGTRIPVTPTDILSSQSNEKGEIFLAKIPMNLVTKENYLIFAKDTPVTGKIIGAKPGRYIIRNGQLVLETELLKTIANDEKIPFIGLADTDYKWNFWTKILRTVFKGAKITIKPDQYVDVVLLKPLKIDLITGWRVD